MNQFKRKLFCCAMIGSLLWGGAVTEAASNKDKDIDAQIAEQQRILRDLNEKKSAQDNEETKKQLERLEAQLKELKKKPSFDTKGAIEAIAVQIVELRKRLDETTQTQARIAEVLEKLEKREQAGNQQGNAPRAQNAPFRSESTGQYLVNPGGGRDRSYTQDAINSQGNSTMIFSYADNQLYKIYCRKGYLTDLAFRKGEKIQFVGGGDTAGWMVSSAEVDGIPHLYIKPVVDTSTTNLIVTTDKHSYQLIVNTAEWFNPMVKWTYGAEDREASILKQQKEDRVTTGSIQTTNVEDLDFAYEISGKGEKPIMVFSDGEQTYIKFAKNVNKKAPLFVQEPGRKQMSLVNYRIKDNYYIVEKVFAKAQIRFSEQEVVTIKHKK